MRQNRDFQKNPITAIDTDLSWWSNRHFPVTTDSKSSIKVAASNLKRRVWLKRFQFRALHRDPESMHFLKKTYYSWFTLVFKQTECTHCTLHLFHQGLNWQLSTCKRIFERLFFDFSRTSKRWKSESSQNVSLYLICPELQAHVSPNYQPDSLFQYSRSQNGQD